MKKYLKDYISDFEKELNIGLMTKASDRPLVEYVKDTWKSLEIVKNIKILKFEYTDRESGIDINDHIFKREKKKKKKDRFNFKFINDDRYGKLKVFIEITLAEDSPETSEKVINKKVIVKEILIPLEDDDGCYFIKGKRYYMIYQLTDKSTYTLSSAVTLKSLMPICVKRQSLKVENVVKNIGKTGHIVTDTSGTEFNLPVYTIKDIPVISYYVANGMDWALNYLCVSHIMRFIDNLNDTDMNTNLYFQISSKCFIEINRELFLKYPYLQSIVGSFLYTCTNRTTLADLYDPDVWIKKLSNANTVEKGKDKLVFFSRLMDEITKKVLLLDDCNKKDAYAVLRWMLMNFNELRMKDNLDLKNKRLRCNEYIAALLTQEFSKRLSKIITLGAKVTMNDFKDMFKFSGELLLQKMHSSGILRFDDTINDMDFFSKYKITTKGPNSLNYRIYSYRH